MTVIAPAAGPAALHAHYFPAGTPLNAFFAWNEAWAARYGPALHHAPEFQPQVVVQPPRCMFLDDELISFGSMHAAPRLQSHVELAFPTIYLKAHRSARTPAFCGGALERDAIPRGDRAEVRPSRK